MTLPGVSEELTALLTLRFTPGLGPLRTEAVRAHFGSASAALTAPREALRGVPGLGARTASLIGAREAHEKARAEVRDAASCGVTLLGRGLDGYPGALEALPDPPAVLWVKGALPALGPVPKAVGIVGTRKASPHGLQFARCLAQDLARAGVIIVSGMARGVDTAAHAAAVKERAPTIGVLGSGVDVIYPAENKQLAANVTLVSEHPLGTPPASFNFPGRNRVIAALSAGSVVVEGPESSGAMITASALECGRTVFAVPGRPGDPLAAGPHKLLREGAVLVERAADILTELGWAATPPTPAPDLPADQARVYAVLDAPLLMDDIAARAGLATPEAQTILMLLRLQGHVQEVPGGRYARA